MRCMRGRLRPCQQAGGQPSRSHVGGRGAGGLKMRHATKPPLPPAALTLTLPPLAYVRCVAVQAGAVGAGARGGGAPQAAGGPPLGALERIPYMYYWEHRLQQTMLLGSCAGGARPSGFSAGLCVLFSPRLLAVHQQPLAHAALVFRKAAQPAPGRRGSRASASMLSGLLVARCPQQLEG